VENALHSYGPSLVIPEDQVSENDTGQDLTETLLMWLGAKLGLRRCRIPYRSCARILQAVQAVNDYAKKLHVQSQTSKIQRLFSQAGFGHWTLDLLREKVSATVWHPLRSLSEK
jgi:hypothetical protein